MTDLDKAIEFAHDCHRGQYRKGSGIPYITHPIEVMKRLSEWGCEDESVLCAAVLHDVIEDCDVTKNELIFKFSRSVAYMVDECSRMGVDGETLEGKWKFMQSFYDKSFNSVMIKLADRLCNVRDYVISGSLEYSKWYALQAYPLYERFAKTDSEIKSGAEFDVAFLSTLASHLMYEGVDREDKQPAYYADDLSYSEEMKILVEDILINKKPKLRS